MDGKPLPPILRSPNPSSSMPPSSPYVHQRINSMRSPVPESSASLLGDTSAFNTPKGTPRIDQSQSPSASYTLLNLTDEEVDRALTKWQKTQGHHAHRSVGGAGGGAAWVNVRKGRVAISRRALLLLAVSAVGLVALVSALSNRGAENELDLSSWRPSWTSSATASAKEDSASTTANDPTKPIKIHKYSGSRQWPSTTYTPFPVLEVLNHATPQSTIHAQFKTGVRYITTMAFGGHANQFISIQKMLFMAKSTSRVGIVPSLIPIHIDGLALPMSAFYDLDRFNADAAVPAIEFVQLKEIDMKSDKPQNERVSCWSTQELAIGFPNGQAWSFDIHDVWVDHWALPPMARGMGGQDVAFDALRMFDFNSWERQQWIDKVRREFLPQEPQRQVEGSKDVAVAAPKSAKENQKPGFDLSTEPPTDQFLCYDNTLFIGPVMFHEAYPGSIPLEDPAPGEDTSWKEVGQHLHFNRELEALADFYLVDLFDCKDASKIPPFLSIHLRRGDFKEFTGFTDLDRYISGLTRLRTRLQARLDNPFSHRGVFLQNFRHFGIKADEYPVVVTTDEEPGTAFWQEVEKMGWKIINHDKLKTKETLGPWHMTMIDAAVLARGQGFVGTAQSTFSHLAGLRVKYWNGGLVDGAF